MKRLLKHMLIGTVSLIFLTFTVNIGTWVWQHISQPQEKYAILISAGQTIYDNKPMHFEYWGDLLIAYKNLIDQGYTHENIYVFYGDGPGDDFNSMYEYYRYNTYWPISTIIDYSNSKKDMFRGFEDLAYKITNKDKLTIYWVIGHGDISLPGGFVRGSADDYKVMFEDYSMGYRCVAKASKADILELINTIKDYKQREIYWFTCHSGSMIEGDLKLNGPKTTVITSSAWDKSSWSICPISHYNYYMGGCEGGYYTSEFNWIMYGIYHNQYFDKDGYTSYNPNLKWPITPYKLYRELQYSNMISTVQLGGQSPTVIWVKAGVFAREVYNAYIDHPYEIVKQFIEDCI